VGRLDQLQRTWKLLATIDGAPRGATVGELARHLGVSVRTVYRDLLALGAAGFPLYSERVAREVSWRFVDGYRFARTPIFSADELAALHLGTSLLEPLAGTWLDAGARSLVRKLEQSLSDEAAAMLHELRGALAARSSPAASYADRGEHIRLLSSAIAQNRRCRMTYTSARSTAPLPRQIDPYALFFQDGALYVAGYDERRREVRTFAVQRIRMLDVTQHRFERPHDFSLETYLGSAFRFVRGDQTHSVRLRVYPPFAAFVRERRWHPSQRLREHNDGSVDLSFEVSALDEVASWLMGFRGAAIALEPPELRAMLREAGERIARAHEAGREVTPAARARTTKPGREKRRSGVDV
jgi:predicted DNA-binding transcriptional regulator YafY